MASADGLADALVEGVEGGFRVDDTPETIVLSNDNTAVEAVVDSVAGFYHGTITGQGKVEG